MLAWFGVKALAIEDDVACTHAWWAHSFIVHSSWVVACCARPYTRDVCHRHMGGTKGEQSVCKTSDVQCLPPLLPLPQLLTSVDAPGGLSCIIVIIVDVCWLDPECGIVVVDHIVSVRPRVKGIHSVLCVTHNPRHASRDGTGADR